MRISKRAAWASVTVSAALGLGAGATWVASAEPPTAHSGTSRTRAAEPGPAPTAGRTVDAWTTNKYGLTVGTPSEADRVAEKIPDLTPVHADNGRAGYIRSADYFVPDPKTPGEAAAQTRNLLNDKGQIELTVYDEDGKTAVGSLIAAEVLQGDLDALP
ncbi:MAG: hypothetical protein EON52_04310 [Actinomycetales bacterium]|nr:MAG: hypothetical protein EON52_04310 [Actinomycetales bacterium]